MGWSLHDVFDNWYLAILTDHYWIHGPSSAFPAHSVLSCVCNPQDGLARIQANLQSFTRKKRISETQAGAILSRVRGVLTYDDFHSVDMVIEAAVENIALKQKIFVELERACNSSCILATNTSTISMKIVGAKTQSSDRIIGAHFFSPAHLMPLLEIVRSDDTSKQVRFDLEPEALHGCIVPEP